MNTFNTELIWLFTIVFFSKIYNSHTKIMLTLKILAYITEFVNLSIISPFIANDLNTYLIINEFQNVPFKA